MVRARSCMLILDDIVLSLSVAVMALFIAFFASSSLNRWPPVVIGHMTDFGSANRWVNLSDSRCFDPGSRSWFSPT